MFPASLAIPKQAKVTVLSSSQRSSSPARLLLLRSRAICVACNIGAEGCIARIIVKVDMVTTNTKLGVNKKYL